MKSAIGRLRDLPNSVDVVLQPPSVELDSRSSIDGKDILATVDVTPGEANGGLNLLTVRTENAGFMRRQIQAGDLVKCYLLPDRESRNRMRETGEAGGFVSFEAIELPVAQVLGPNSLRLARDLRIPTRVAQDMFTDLDQETLRFLDSQGAVNSYGIALKTEMLEQVNTIAWPFKIEVWRVRDDRMQEVDLGLKKYAAEGEPAFGWEPSGDSVELDQLLQRINQWTRSRTQPDDWAPAKLLDTIDAKLKEGDLAEYQSAEALKRVTFADYEGRLLQEAIWLRDISRWASGDEFDPAKRGATLFDWLVRNVALSTDPRVTSNRPWQTLLAGRGGAAQRAWLFAGLCRQQQIPMAVIEVPQPEGAPWLWCAVLDEGELYLFDPQLGLPLPTKPDGSGIATLSMLKEKPDLLRQLDLGEAKYPVAENDLDSLQVRVVAEPMSLSWRAAEFQSQLRGQDSLVLNADADALAEQFSQAGVGDVNLWAEPFDYFRRRLRFGKNNRNAQRLEFQHYAWRPVLWQARMLHFRGLFESEEEAHKKAERENNALYEAVNDHRRAAQRYTDRSVRPSDDRLAAVPIDKRRIYQRAKVDATYWLGLLKFEQGAYKSSQQWFESSALDQQAAAHRSAGVNYNRARVLEALGNPDAAVSLLEADESPQQHGNRLRAKWLRGENSEADEGAEGA